jgi:hypothetical protein
MAGEFMIPDDFAVGILAAHYCDWPRAGRDIQRPATWPRISTARQQAHANPALHNIV